MTSPYDHEAIRRARGREIALRGRISVAPGGWLVRSPGSPQGQFVKRTHSGLKCSCEDFQDWNLPCKHAYAVTDYLAGVKRDLTAPETKEPRRESKRNWGAYHDYQNHEGEWFPIMLHDLCQLVQYEPEGARIGRPRIPIRDSIFAAGIKLYSNMSAARCMPEVRTAGKQGFLDIVPSSNSLLAFIQDEGNTPILNRLIAASSTPLKAIEHDFAIDSTGFGTRRYYHHYGTKREDYTKEEVVKLHASVGVITQIIARARVTDGYVNDHKEFADLVESTKHVFELEDVCADKAYLSHSALELVDSLGGTPFIPFKKNSRANPKAPLWDRFYHFFHSRREEFLPRYHKRSNVESAFASLKAKFSPYLRNKALPSQRNELLLKVLVYNITCVTRAMYDLGVDPAFEMPPPLPGTPKDGAENGSAWRLL